jgi:3-hydroxyacyl-[acyl-carrier-protein] dehydratase
MQCVGRFVIPANHPSLQGHFPGQPIVPGVVLIDNAVSVLLEQMPNHDVAGITCKFVAPVRPGNAVDVTASVMTDGCRTFACAITGSIVARGTLTLRQSAEAYDPSLD